MERLLTLVHDEIERRKNLDEHARQRREQIKKEYQPLYRDLYRFQVGEEMMGQNDNPMDLEFISLRGA